MKVTTSTERAERAAVPEPARIPSGDRPAYSTDEGQT
jgi:branched-chain amino acid transport system permease protein